MKEQDAAIHELEQDIGKRLLILSVDARTGELECDADSFSGWEVVGLAAWLEVWGKDMMTDDGDEDDQEWRE